MRDFHAAPAAARRRLDEDGIADLGADAQSLLVIADGARRAWHAGDAQPHRRPLGLDLVAHNADMLGAWADESDVVLAEDFGEAGVFREEAIAGMDRVGAGDFAGRQQRGDVEIGIARRGWPDADALVGEFDMHRLRIGRRMDGDGGDAQLLGGAQDAQRNLAPVGNKDLIEHP